MSVSMYIYVCLCVCVCVCVCACPAVTSDTPAPPPPSPLQETAPLLFRAAVLALIALAAFPRLLSAPNNNMLSLPFPSFPSSSSSSFPRAVYTRAVGGVVTALPLLLLLAVSLVGKLGTLRLLDAGQGGAGGIRQVGAGGEVTFYDHKETDEKIFEVLVHSVSRNLSLASYHLPAETIETFGLAKDNYGAGGPGSLFIHPPLFVLLCVFAQWALRLPLPAVPLLCHALTCLLVAALPRALCDLFVPGGGGARGGGRGGGRGGAWGGGRGGGGAAGVWAMALYTFCPIVSFVSQKV
jgi:hypothetical protein